MRRIPLPIFAIWLAVGSVCTGQDNAPDPAAARGLYERATHLDAKHVDDALADLTKAIELDPRLSEAYFARSGLLTEAKQDYRSAVADLTRFLELEPRSYSGLFNRGLWRDTLRDADGAIADFTAALSPTTDFSRVGGKPEAYRAHAYHYRGRVYQKTKKDYASAAADYTEALRLNPKIEMVHYRRGQTYHELKKYADADRDFAAAFEQDPAYSNLLTSWAWQLATCADEKYRDEPKALKFARQLNAEPGAATPSNLDLLAAAYAANGDFSNALKTQLKAISLLSGKHNSQTRAIQARALLYAEKKPYRE